MALYLWRDVLWWGQSPSLHFYHESPFCLLETQSLCLFLLNSVSDTWSQLASLHLVPWSAGQLYRACPFPVDVLSQPSTGSAIGDPGSSGHPWHVGFVPLDAVTWWPLGLVRLQDSISIPTQKRTGRTVAVNRVPFTECSQEGHSCANIWLTMILSHSFGGCWET